MAYILFLMFGILFMCFLSKISERKKNKQSIIKKVSEAEVVSHYEGTKNATVENNKLQDTPSMEVVKTNNKINYTNTEPTNLEYLGPAKGWVDIGMFYPTWISVAGVNHDNIDGTPRLDIISRCREGGKLDLYWEKGNSHDEFAVAILNKKKEQIGYIPRELSRGCVEAYQFDEVRINAIITKIYKSDSGYVDVKIKLIEFYNEAKRINECSVLKQTNLYEFLFQCLTIEEKHIESLQNAGVLTPESLSGITNKDLTAIHGIKPAGVKRIRSEFPKKTIPKK